MSPNAFYEKPNEFRNMQLAFRGKAEKVCETTAGFAGEIVFLDNGENVYPRFIAAKYPRCRADMTPGERARRFSRELKLQASAHYHPNVHWPFQATMILGVPVAYFRRWEGDLSNYIEDGSLGDVGRLSLLIQLIAGLAHCHEKGLVHQDLKPENVFIQDLRTSFRDLPDADFWLRPLVADFGSVNVAADKGIFTGTRPYMAPEQWGKETLGEWTSVFVVGIMLHELMSRGVHPIGVHSGAWRRRQQPEYKQWQSSKYWRPWIAAGCPISQPVADTDIARLVAACLAPDPRYRPTLSGLQGDLKIALRARSQSAFDNVALFLRTAEEQAGSGEWKHLQRRLELLGQAIEAEFPEN